MCVRECAYWLANTKHANTEMHIVGGVIKPCLSNFFNFKSSQTAQYMFKTRTVVTNILTRILDG